MGASLPAKDSARQGMKARRNTIADSFFSASGLRPRQARNKITTFEMFQPLKKLLFLNTRAVERVAAYHSGSTPRATSM